jgi:hypothetical protein
MEFFVTFAGHVSRRLGHHRLTKIAIDEMIKAYKAINEAPSKGDLNTWKPGHGFTFIRD